MCYNIARICGYTMHYSVWPFGIYHNSGEKIVYVDDKLHSAYRRNRSIGLRHKLLF